LRYHGMLAAENLSISGGVSMVFIFRKGLRLKVKG
jgi:hypothetical protein